MTRRETFPDISDIHPIDIVESLAEHAAWQFDRVAEDQIAMAIAGQWRDYAISLLWSEPDETLRLVASFEMNPPPARLPALYEVLNLANDRCWAGAFTWWADHGIMAWRYGLVLAGGETAGSTQIARLVERAVTECERFYPAFQMVAWGDADPAVALGMAMEDARGSA